MGKASILLVCLLLGCSGDSTPKAMDKATAAKEIKSLLSTSDNAISLEIGRVGTSCGELDSAGREQKFNQSPMINVSSIVAQKAGYVTVQPDGKGFWKVALTEQGQAALAASKEKPYAHNALEGCDYQQVDFVVVTPELVSVESVTADENDPEVDYLFKWNTTDLGRALRLDGKVFPALTPLQQAELQTHIHALVELVRLPVPPDDYTRSGRAKFKKLTDGWRIE